MKLTHLFHPNKWVKRDDIKIPAFIEIPAKNDGDASSESSTNFSDSTRSEKRNGRSSGDKKRTSKRSVVANDRSANEKVVFDFLAAMNNHSSVGEKLSFFSSAAVPVKFEDAPSVTSEFYILETHKAQKSFPDIHFQWVSIKETKAGTVLVEDLQVGGTHTGEPYAFANFPPIPATNKHINNDPERLWITVRDGKIAIMDVISLGDTTGPLGFYTQVGGNMYMPPPSDVSPSGD
ncbi:expressed unknown protein [Seminavis robusta]|uniref:Uncharacterized protein n=1 Tax=Seminavis robusta TaxID=568900 RepID=A0A9N8DKT7_9STRA|nr:expressed unknown protein [Seminavis robusta]|eukprot:Sro140_g065340.1 n/a (234) ;mRNA; f:11647-12348